ncbi:MAG: alpha/beta hydrolase [Sphingobium sp.]|nr:MAG: alpha/beta hydrolase [Sphingobium sp.]
MTDILPPPDYLARPDGLRLAYRQRPGAGPTIVFLPGYMSDMDGGKAVALDAWAATAGRAMLRLDYAGCGASEGAFEEGTLASWRDDALFLIDTLTNGPAVLVGSSMGGWLALLIALARPDRTAALVGIAAAPDFTDWGFTPAQLARMEADGRLVEDTPYGDQPYVTTLAFHRSGQANLLLGGPVAIDCPVRLLQGQRDPNVPWDTALRIAQAVRSSDVQTLLIKDGDHRLSRDADIAHLLATVASLPDPA